MKNEGRMKNEGCMKIEGRMKNERCMKNEGRIIFHMPFIFIRP